LLCFLELKVDDLLLLVIVITQADGALCDLSLWSCCKEALEVVRGLETHHVEVVNGY
jgi:hypothetical protein